MRYEIVIVGARVAGASLAHLLGRRARLPSATLSTNLLLPGTVAALHRLGVLPAVEALGLRRITRQRRCFTNGGSLPGCRRLSLVRAATGAPYGVAP